MFRLKQRNLNYHAPPMPLSRNLPLFVYCPQTDEFQIPCRSLGTLRELVIGHDNSGLNPNWHLEVVSITDLAAKITYWCVCMYESCSCPGAGVELEESMPGRGEASMCRHIRLCLTCPIPLFHAINTCQVCLQQVVRPVQGRWQDRAHPARLAAAA